MCGLYLKEAIEERLVSVIAILPVLNSANRCDR